ncbi:hypothetical protein D7V86_07230 [bacterium D16-51]|nr:hypothetical protein D7V96_10395 [bacterium D16-59]RKI60870.1 hypothetical protein D7V86_07230 [bacterium D16-51]
MQRITDYSFLFQNMRGALSRNKVNPIKVSQLSSRSVQAQLKAAGINTNSKQYKAVVSAMTQAAGGRTAYTNIQAIKNQMKSYDKDGDYIDPTTGLAGLLVTDKNRAEKNRIIDIPESSRQEMFDLTKKEFLRENGVSNGNRTKRSDVYTHLYRKMKKEDRLAAGHTLEQYERAYRKAFVEAVKKVSPSWQAGRPIPSGALDGVTRESVESTLVQSGSSLIKQSMDIMV